MSDERNPAAFPRPWSGSGVNLPEIAQEGMSLRDWFAGQALNPLMRIYGCGPYAAVASAAYAIADAMLEARR